jgi:hypothetical protein
MAHYDIPLDLPHAGRMAGRIEELLARHVEDRGLDAGSGASAVLDVAEELDRLLFPYTVQDENPEESEAQAVREKAAVLGRKLVDALEAAGIAGDRLGQFVRNLFECLALGEEGARISLRAGENPASLQRPV